MLLYRLVLVCTAGLFGGLIQAEIESSPEALNPQLTNIIPNGDGPVLHYNGSGPVPDYNVTSPAPYPLSPLSTDEIKQALLSEARVMDDGNLYAANCSECIRVFETLHLASLTQPESVVTELLVDLCESTSWIKKGISASSCSEEFSGIGNLGPYMTLLFRKMSQTTGDMEAFCHYKYSFCDEPQVIAIDESQYFSPKPNDKAEAPAPSGETINVLHLSDWHLDPRYDIGSEGNCSSYMCCRSYRTNGNLHTTSTNASWPASRFGNLYCDTPPDLGLSLFTTMAQFVNLSEISFSLFTGDVVSHDDKDQVSRAYVEYEETVTYETFKAHLGNIPVYATLGNHDTLPDNFATPYSLSNSTDKDNFSWNYDLVASLWREMGWLDNATAAEVATHYGGYAYTTPQGLKIISINTDFWYTSNLFNYFNFTNPDQSGILRFLAAELQASESAGQRVWIIGHVPSGYGGTGINGKALHNPSALFHAIVRRFAPATVAGVFWGHLHYDQLMVYYDWAATSSSSSLSANNSTLRNTTSVDGEKPIAWAHIAPSITPLTGLNAGWTLYQVDKETFEVTNWQTYIANMSEANAWTTPVWQFEYDARAAYDPAGAWPAHAPLNASFWHRVTGQMLAEGAGSALVERYNLFETKSSVDTKNCSSRACVEQKVCYMRSGNTMLGDLCPQGNGPF